MTHSRDTRCTCLHSLAPTLCPARAGWGDWISALRQSLPLAPLWIPASAGMTHSRACPLPTPGWLRSMCSIIRLSCDFFTQRVRLNHRLESAAGVRHIATHTANRSFQVKPGAFTSAPTILTARCCRQPNRHDRYHPLASGFARPAEYPRRRRFRLYAASCGCRVSRKYRCPDATTMPVPVAPA